MHDLILLIAHVLSMLVRLAGTGVTSLIAESALLKHQLLIVNRPRHRAPNLRVTDRFVVAVCSLFIRPSRLVRSAIILKPSAILNFHRNLVKLKYRLLFCPKRRAKPGPKGPTQDLIHAVVEMKLRNPDWGCPPIAAQISLAFGVLINKDVVRRILATHYHPSPDAGGGPSWLTFLGHMKDSLWSIDLFRCESLALRTYWVLIAMDQYTRRIIGFGINAGISIRGATHRHDPTKVSRSDTFLDSGRSGGQALRLPTLL
jgi:putative transposase